MTARNFLVRGLIAGFIAGIFAFSYGHFIGERQVDAAIAVEQAASAAAPAVDEPVEDAAHSTEVSRTNQRGWGLATGLLSVGTAVGGAIGLVSAFAVGRLGRLRPAQSTAAVVLMGFISFALVPFLKYPSTPPAVGDEDTIGQRTLDFFLMQGISVLAAVGFVLLARRLLTSMSVFRTVLIAAAGYVVVVVVTGAILPTVNELGEFPADILWYFRRDSLATLAIM